MINMLEDWTICASLKQLETQNFEPKIRMRIEAGSYIIKTVETREELTRVLSLRHDIFYREYKNAELPFGLDIDSYDFTCDHLVIEEAETKKLVGTYRLICSSFSNRFYSQSEFNLGTLLGTPGVKLELGRACIDRSFRSGAVVALLWRGLARYIREVKADYLFGCSSAKTVDPAEIRSITHYLREQGVVSDQYGVTPLPEFEVPRIDSDTPLTPERIKELIPSLLNSYIKAGAKICGDPALDRDFQCADFFTVLRTQQLTEVFDRKYQVT